MYRLYTTLIIWNFKWKFCGVNTDLEKTSGSDCTRWLDGTTVTRQHTETGGYQTQNLMKVVYASAIKKASGTNSATRRIATFARKLLVRRLFLKFTTKPIRHYPPHLTHVPTQPWEIKNQIFCRYSADMEESANKSSAVAEMGDRLATIDMGRRVGRGCCVLGPHWVPI